MGMATFLCVKQSSQCSGFRNPAEPVTRLSFGQLKGQQDMLIQVGFRPLDVPCTTASLRNPDRFPVSRFAIAAAPAWREAEHAPVDDFCLLRWRCHQDCMECSPYRMRRPPCKVEVAEASPFCTLVSAVPLFHLSVGEWARGEGPGKTFGSSRVMCRNARNNARMIFTACEVS